MGRALQIAEWAKQNEIALGGIGLDIEPPYRMMAQMNTGNFRGFARSLINYRMRNLRQGQAQNSVSRINDSVAQLREDQGIYVETYTAPPLLHKFLGLPTPSNVDGGAEMLYSSLYPFGNALFSVLWGIEQHSPALGIVNGVPGQTPGRDFGGKLAGMPENQRESALRKMHLTDEQLARDLQHANSVSIRKLGQPLSRIYVFALNAPNVAIRVSRIRKYILGGTGQPVL